MSQKRPALFRGRLRRHHCFVCPTAVHHEAKISRREQARHCERRPKVGRVNCRRLSVGEPNPRCSAVKNSEVWRICAFLSGRMGRPALDQTGLTELYNFVLRLDTLEGLSSSEADFKTKMSDWSSSSIFFDIQKQLGLQLISGKAPVEYLVIDPVERPSEN